MLDDNYEDFDYDDQYEQEHYAELDFHDSVGHLGDSSLSDPDFDDLDFADYVSSEPPELVLDVPYVPTENHVVQLMLDMAEVNSDDLLFDLGCGDGRIVVTAALQRGARGVGVDLDPARIADAMELASHSRVEHLVDFMEEDLRNVNLTQATVVTLYLLEHMNLEIKSKLLQELAPGTRIVSNSFAMGDWQPLKQTRYRHSNIYLWQIPEHN